MTCDEIIQDFLQQFIHADKEKYDRIVNNIKNSLPDSLSEEEIQAEVYDTLSNPEMIQQMITYLRRAASKSKQEKVAAR